VVNSENNFLSKEVPKVEIIIEQENLKILHKNLNKLNKELNLLIKK